LIHETLMKQTELVERFRNPLRVLAFNGSLRLVAIFQSYSAAEKITGSKHQILLKCCNGQMISSKGFYFREVPEDTIIDVDDLNTLTLLEFDKQMGFDRHIYATRNMRRNEVIKESQYKNRFSVLTARHSKQWKKSKSK